MHFAEPGSFGGAAVQPATIDPTLDLDMRLSFELKVSFASAL